MVFWTEGSIRAVISSELSGKQGKEITCEHVKALLREQVSSQLGDELRSVLESLAEGTKAALQRKLNTIYTTHIDRLRQRLDDFERELERASPKYLRQLEELKKDINKLALSNRKLLDEPRRELETVTLNFKNDLCSETQKIHDNFHKQARVTVRQLEKKIEDVYRTKLHDMILETIREYVRSAPFEQDHLSNKQLTATKGISLRAAKRLRRAS